MMQPRQKDPKRFQAELTDCIQGKATLITHFGFPLTPAKKKKLLIKNESQYPTKVKKSSSLNEPQRYKNKSEILCKTV